MTSSPSLFTPRARRSVPITATFTPDEAVALREYAERFGISRAELLRSAIASYISDADRQEVIAA